MKLAFLGTGAFAVPSLQLLGESRHTLALVITQPDRKKGRGLRTQPSPVKEIASDLAIPILHPEKAAEIPPLLKQARLEAVTVVAYGLILTADALASPRHGCVNLHASLLPQYRGPAPINWALINGETQTGITTILMDEGIDTGDILLQTAFPISSGDSAQDLHDRLARKGATLLLETLERMELGALTPKPQDERQASYAPKLKKSDGDLRWEESAATLANRLRGCQPWPGAFTFLDEKRILIEKAAQSEQSGDMVPGTILALVNEALLVQCGGGTTLLIHQLKPEGRRAMSGRAFLHGGFGARSDQFESKEPS